MLRMLFVDISAGKPPSGRTRGGHYIYYTCCIITGERFAVLGVFFTFISHPLHCVEVHGFVNASMSGMFLLCTSLVEGKIRD